MRATIRRWLTRVFIGLAGAVLLGVVAQWFIQVAADKGLYTDAGKAWDRAMSAVLDFVVSPYTTYPLAVLGGLVIGVYFDSFMARRERRVGASALEEVRGKIFTNETVELDGKRFVRCEFHSVRLKYAGGPFELAHNQFFGSPMIESVGDSLNRYTVLLAEMGKLSGRVLTKDGEFKPTTEKA